MDLYNIVTSSCMWIKKKNVETREQWNKTSQTHLTQDMTWETLSRENPTGRWGHSSPFFGIENRCEYK